MVIIVAFKSSNLIGIFPSKLVSQFVKVFGATLAFSMYSIVIEPLKLQLEDEIFTSYLPSEVTV